MFWPGHILVHAGFLVCPSASFAGDDAELVHIEGNWLQSHAFHSFHTCRMLEDLQSSLMLTFDMQNDTPCHAF
jgi:hypothetical protein